MRKNFILLMANALFFVGISLAWAEAEWPLSPVIVGQVFEYKTTPGDTLSSIGARHGIDPVVLGAMNGMQYQDVLKVGRVLSVDSRHIVPPPLPEGILVNLPQRMLYLFEKDHVAAYFPAGPGHEDWPTPEGEFKVTTRVDNPVWYIPKDLQEELRAEGKIVRTQIAPGPDNPLGRFWIGLNVRGYGIHGTIAPSSVYHFLSHGCIRLHNDDISALFPKIKTGGTVKIIYEAAQMAEVDGKIYVEVHRDAYIRGVNPLTRLKRIAKAHGFAERIEWARVDEAIRSSRGMVTDVTR